MSEQKAKLNKNYTLYNAEHIKDWYEIQIYIMILQTSRLARLYNVSFGGGPRIQRFKRLELRIWEPWKKITTTLCIPNYKLF